MFVEYFWDTHYLMGGRPRHPHASGIFLGHSLFDGGGSHDIRMPEIPGHTVFPRGSFLESYCQGSRIFNPDLSDLCPPQY